jgi:hypothetical protein
VARRILSGVVFLLLSLSGAYATASPRVISPARIEISIVEREAVEQQNLRARLPRICEIATPRPAAPASPRAGLASVLYQRPPPTAQMQI